MPEILNIAGAIALLVWGLYMIKTGIFRTFGERLRKWLSTRLTTRTAGFAAGFGLAVLLQSSTATALLVAGLQNKGLVSTAVALGSVLGADLGSAVMVQVLSLDLSPCIPALVLIGVTLFIARPDMRLGQFGRILLGLAFIMMALKMIVSATTPLKESATLLHALGELGQSSALSAALGVVLAMVCFSSLAAVTLAASVYAAGIITLPTGLWIVLGANLGSALLAVITTFGSSATTRRAPTGNLIFRTGGILIGGLLLDLSPQFALLLGHYTAPLILFHLALNAIIGAVGLLLVEPVGRLVERLLPAPALLPSDNLELASEENTVSPEAALLTIALETGNTAQLMAGFWERLEIFLKTNPPEGVRLAFRDELARLSKRTEVVTAFLARVLHMNLTSDDALIWQQRRAANDALVLSIDVMTQFIDLVERRKCREELYFSSEGQRELLAEHREIARAFRQLVPLLSSPETSQSTEAVDSLRTLLAERDAAIASLLTTHMARVAKGTAGALDTSALHVELLSLFRRLELAILSATGMALKSATKVARVR